jgi:hypothetical protein
MKIRNFCHKRSVKSKTVKDKKGVLITNEGKQLQRWKENFPEILKDHTGQIHSAIIQHTAPTTAIPTEQPTKVEMIIAIQESNKGKDPGTDNVTPGSIKNRPRIHSKISEPLLKEIWEQEVLPDEWKEGILIGLPKKGDLTNCNN